MMIYDAADLDRSSNIIKSPAMWHPLASMNVLFHLGSDGRCLAFSVLPVGPRRRWQEALLVVGAMRSAGGADRPDEQLTTTCGKDSRSFLGGGSNIFQRVETSTWFWSWLLQNSVAQSLDSYADFCCHQQCSHAEKQDVVAYPLPQHWQKVQLWYSNSRHSTCRYSRFMWH